MKPNLKKVTKRNTPRLILTIIFLYFFNLPSTKGQIDSIDYANKMGVSYRSRVNIHDNPNESIIHLKKAIYWFEKAKNYENVVGSMNDLFNAYFYTESFDSCFMIADKASVLCKSHLKENSEAFITTKADLGMVNYIKSNYFKAIQFFKTAVELDEKYTKNKVYININYSNIGLPYYNLGDYDESISFYKKAYEVILDTLGENCQEAARTLVEIGDCYKAKNQFDEALTFYFRAISILDKLERKEYFDQTRWYAYVYLAEIYLKKGDRANVLYYSKEAIKISNRYNLLEDFKTWTVLGKLYQQEQNYPKALEYFSKALHAAEEEFASFRNHPQVAVNIASMANVHAETGDNSKALRLYQKSLQAIAVGFFDDDYQCNPEISQFINKSDALDILISKSKSLYSAFLTNGNLYDLQATNDCYQLMADLVQSIRQDYLAEGSKHTLSERAMPIYDQAIKVAIEMHERTANPKYLEQAFAYAENNKAVILYENIRDQMAKGFAGIPDSLIEKERDLLANINFFKKQILENRQKLTPTSSAKIKEWESKLFEQKEAYNTLISYLEKSYPAYFNLKYKLEPINVSKIQQKLSGENTVLIEYMLGDQHCFAFLVTATTLKVFNLGSKEEIQAQLQSLRLLLGTPPNTAHFGENYATFTQNAYNLHKILLSKPLEQIPKNIQSLVIVPDNQLCLLPFEMLLDEVPNRKAIDFSPKNLSYLFEKFSISYNYSASLFAIDKEEQSENSKTLRFLGFAPTFGPAIAESRACTNDQLYSLQCNRKEITNIAALLNGSTYTGDKANLSSFMQKSVQCDILHLATHACVDEETPELSKIFFADNFITQSDIGNLKLHNLLTVLSACNTGNGKVLRGEGVMSLTRSFLMAGSASVLTSLWSVDDCATSDIMLEYYRQIENGLPKDIALQKAKLAYLDMADENNSHPYFWAAFVQFGATKPLVEKHNYAYLIIALIALATIGFIHFKIKEKGKKKPSQAYS